MLSFLDRNANMYLTNAERIVMKSIWDADHELVLHEILNDCKTRFGKEWKSQTVSTYLRHLVEKGFLQLKRSGKYCNYGVLISKEEYFRFDSEGFAEYWNLDEQFVQKLIAGCCQA